MAKRGRKPNPDKKKGYFFDKEENAVRAYLSTNDECEKNIIFNTILRQPLTTMIESIIRTYNLQIPDEDFEQTFNDTISFLIMKMSKFDIDRKKKAYSYFGTICKNYLLLKINQFNKKKVRNLSYDDVAYETNIEEMHTYNIDESSSDVAVEIINRMLNGIQTIIDNGDLNTNELKIGISLKDLLMNWDELLIGDGSNKFNKSSVLYYIREATLLNTSEIRDGMKKFKKIYKLTKEDILR